MVRFTIFGIPVEVQPLFWLTGALLGGAFDARSPETILAMLLFMMAAFVSVLIHELGHALTGIRLGGGTARIELVALGGLAYNIGGRFSRSGDFWRIFAGPGAGFAFFLLIIAVLAAAFGFGQALDFVGLTVFGLKPSFGFDSSMFSFFLGKPYVFKLVNDLLWINFWWGVLNLLPVLPLDGGKIADLFVVPQQRVYQIGVFFSIITAAIAFLWLRQPYMGLLFAFLAWKNYSDMGQVRWR